MLQPTISKLHNFITKLVVMLEDELNNLQRNSAKNLTKEQKNIADILNKLVVLIIQLNKLSKEESRNDKVAMHLDDQEIIKHFLDSYNKKPDSQKD